MKTNLMPKAKITLVKKALAVSAFVLFASGSASLYAGSLEEDFKTPPAGAHPHTWWHWNNGNVSKEGITLDLEAMHRIGVTGAQIFNVKQCDLEGPILTGSPEWRDLTKFAIQEADRIGIELTIHNCPGWSESGGPWIAAEQSMQKVVWTKTQVKGGKRFTGILEQPETVLNHYRDIAVLAFPMSAEEESLFAIAKTIAIGEKDGKLVPATLNAKAPAKLTFAPKDQRFVQIEFAAPVKASAISFKGGMDKIEMSGTLEASDDGKAFRRIAALPMKSLFVDGFIGFPETTARVFRLSLVATGGKAGKVIFSEIEFAGLRISGSGAKAGYRPDLNLVFSDKPQPAISCIDRNKIIDLTAKLGADGKLDWEIPAGHWTVLRLGHTTTGKKNSPAPASGTGLECDKMSRAAVEANFAGMMGKVIADAGPLAGKSLKMVLADSWEAGCQNWTPAMREEFTKRRGYDPLPWLPCIAGLVVGSLDESERFLWDFRRTIADLIAENHYGTIQELCHKHNMRFTAEAPGIGMPTIADQLQCKARTDVPMGEFWIDGHNDSREPACAAHIGGQQIATAEAFTARTDDAKWAKTPFDHKALGDLNFCRGINRFVFHRYAMQPWKDRFPGMTMGPWGTNFERTNTWWEQAKPWMDYLSRSQALLQSGLFQADILYFYGEGAPVALTGREPKIPAGYDYDAIDAEALLKNLTVTDGRLTLPSGMSYRVLLLPTTDRLTPAVLRKIKELAAAGATILGSRPVKSPSLAGYPQCDAEIAALATELWGNAVEAAGSHPFGKGRVVWGKPLAELLAESGLKADFDAGDMNAKCTWIHRRAGDADIYFVSNQSGTAKRFNCTFRVAGKAPELWHPDSGKTESAPIFSEKDGQTTLPLQFDSAGSVFVIFRKPSANVDVVLSATRDGKDPYVESSHGDLTITKAVYGAKPEVGASAAEVTAKLAAAIANGELHVRADNDLFGKDPARNQVKKLWVDYAYRPQGADEAAVIRKSLVVNENTILELPPAADMASRMPAFELVRADNGTLTAAVTQPGVYEVKTRSGKTLKSMVEKLPATQPVEGPWSLRFPPKWGAPEQVTLEKLISWTAHPDDGVRHFSGTAAYIKEFEWKNTQEGARHYLDLGSVKELAQVILNGKDLGILWKPPFRVEITGALQPGMNSLEVRVTNLWPNRLIGDAALPVEKRLTWSTFQPYKANDPLLPSGLLGPVKIQAQAQVELR